jgi:GDPmannose 4,6-dehydratase/GDP-4-dehydro-6-deoxy-D-mannose reductase
MTKVLITGINGSGGSYLAEHLIKKKNVTKVYGTIRNVKSLKEYNLSRLIKSKKIKIIKCDLNNFKQTKKLIKKTKFNYLFHLASNADVLGSFFRPREIILNNNNCTLNLLESLRLNKSKAKILICSTSEVYGNIGKKNKKITESSYISPINPYAVSKTFQDLISQNYFQIYDLKIVITRMFTYFNAKRDNLFASAFSNQIIKLEKSNGNVLTHGNLNSQRTVLDIRDAMEAYYLAAIRGKPGEIYNIGGLKKATVGQILKQLISLSSKKIKTKLDKNLLRPKDISYQVPDSSKFKKDTKWKEKYKFEESLKFLLDETRARYLFLNK